MLVTQVRENTTMPSDVFVQSGLETPATCSHTSSSPPFKIRYGSEATEVKATLRRTVKSSFEFKKSGQPITSGAFPKGRRNEQNSKKYKCKIAPTKRKYYQRVQ